MLHDTPDINYTRRALYYIAEHKREKIGIFENSNPDMQYDATNKTNIMTN